MKMTMDQITAAYPNVAKLESQAGRELLAAVMEQLQAVVAENVGLKSALGELRRVAFNARRNSHNCGPFQYSDLCETIISESKSETPATDRFVAEMKAQGVEASAVFCGEENSVFVEAKAYYRSLPDAAYEFAKQLREVGQ